MHPQCHHEAEQLVPRQHSAEQHTALSKEPTNSVPHSYQSHQEGRRGRGRPEPIAQPRVWSDLFKKNRTRAEDMTLKLLKKQEGRAILATEDVESIEDIVGFCLVGGFLGRFPGWKAVKELTARWKAAHKMLTHQSLWLIFKFSTKELSDAVLMGGPYISYGCPLYLKAMPLCFTFQPKAQN